MLVEGLVREHKKWDVKYHINTSGFNGHQDCELPEPIHDWGELDQCCGTYPHRYKALRSSKLPFLNRKLKRKISEPHTDQIKVTDNVATPRHTTLSTWNAATAKSNPRAPVRLSKPYFMVKIDFLTLSRLRGKLFCTLSRTFRIRIQNRLKDLNILYVNSNQGVQKVVPCKRTGSLEAQKRLKVNPQSQL